MMIVLLPQVGYISSLEGIVVMGYVLVPFTVNSSHLNRDVKKGLKKKTYILSGESCWFEGGVWKNAWNLVWFPWPQKRRACLFVFFDDSFLSLRVFLVLVWHEYVYIYMYIYMYMYIYICIMSLGFAPVQRIYKLILHILHRFAIRMNKEHVRTQKAWRFNIAEIHTIYRQIGE